MPIITPHKTFTDLPKGLTPKTAEVFETVSKLNCIKGLYLCGGTAQSIMMNHRLSEDLDFELIGTKKERPGLDFKNILEEIKETFPGTREEILGSDHFLMHINNGSVKLSFYRPENPVKYINNGYTYNNIVTPSYQDLLGMKIFTTGVRTKTRDYYDIYCLLEHGCNLKEAISYASYLSRHTDKSKNMLSRLLNKNLYPIDNEFLKMQPRYNITSQDIYDRNLKAIKEENIKSSQNPKYPKL